MIFNVVHEMISKRYQFNETNTLNSIQFKIELLHACHGPWPDRDPKSLENTLFVLISRTFNEVQSLNINEAILKTHSRSHSKSGGSI
jgi:hypothetical protein